MQVTDRVREREPDRVWRVLTKRIGGLVQLKEQGARGGVTRAEATA
jgi:hypothetical protein